MKTENWYSRSELLLGNDAVNRLRQATVLIAGLGGVGGYVAEILARSGIGKLIIVDADTVSITNINRQIIATSDNVGKAKTELWRQRMLLINPDMEIIAVREFITPDSAAVLLDTQPDFVADAIDTVAPKCAFIKQCTDRDIPLISSMGAGGRIDPTKIRYGTLKETNGDGLARTLRYRLKRMNTDIDKINVVWSSETPMQHAVIDLNERNKRSSFGTLASIPAIFGIYMANHIIRKITGI